MGMSSQGRRLCICADAVKIGELSGNAPSVCYGNGVRMIGPQILPSAAAALQGTSALPTSWRRRPGRTTAIRTDLPHDHP